MGLVFSKEARAAARAGKRVLVGAVIDPQHVDTASWPGCGMSFAGAADPSPIVHARFMALFRAAMPDAVRPGLDWRWQDDTAGWIAATEDGRRYTIDLSEAGRFVVVAWAANASPQVGDQIGDERGYEELGDAKFIAEQHEREGREARAAARPEAPATGHRAPGGGGS